MDYYSKYIKYKKKYLKMIGGIEVSLLPLHLISEVNVQQLLKITSDDETMKFIGNGEKKWDEKMIRSTMKYSKLDFDSKNNMYFHFGIMIDKKLVGYIGLHPMLRPYNDDLQLRIFIDKNERGKNLSVLSINKLLEFNKKYIKKTIWCVSNINNIPSNKMAVKSGAIYKFTDKINGINNNFYVYDG